MKTNRHTFLSAIVAAAGAAVAVLILSCAQPLDFTEASSAGGKGGVVLTASTGSGVSASSGIMRTVLPTETPAFTRYALVLSKQGSNDIEIADAQGVGDAGYIHSLEAGVWTVTVTAYQIWTVTGTNTESEYPAARGSAMVTVIEDQTIWVTVELRPIPITETEEKGIFTYSATFPDDVSGTLTLTLENDAQNAFSSSGSSGDQSSQESGTQEDSSSSSGSSGTSDNNDSADDSGKGSQGDGTQPVYSQVLTSREEVSVKIAPGYYHLVLSLTKGGTNETGTVSAGVSEAVHIYAGLESKAEFTFGDEDFTQTVYLAGTLVLPDGATLSDTSTITITVYSDANYATEITPVSELMLSGAAWTVGIPVGTIGTSPLYLKAEVTDSQNQQTIYTCTGNTGGVVPEAGMWNITLIAEDANSTDAILVITDIPLEFIGPGGGDGEPNITIGIFPTGTTPDAALRQEGIVAGADSNRGNVTLSGNGPYTATAQLYTVDSDSSGARWTDPGPDSRYDIYFIVESPSADVSGGGTSGNEAGNASQGTAVVPGGTRYYVAYGISFTSNVASVSAVADFQLVYFGGNGKFPPAGWFERTVEITGVPDADLDTVITVEIYQTVEKNGQTETSTVSTIASSADDTITLADDTVTARLYLPSDDSAVSYGIRLTIIGSTNAISVYEKDAVTFTNGTASVVFTDFTEVVGKNGDEGDGIGNTDV
jgi:hypothetical protein